MNAVCRYLIKLWVMSGHAPADEKLKKQSAWARSQLCAARRTWTPRSGFSDQVVADLDKLPCLRCAGCLFTISIIKIAFVADPGSSTRLTVLTAAVIPEVDQGHGRAPDAAQDYQGRAHVPRGQEEPRRGPRARARRATVWVVFRVLNLYRHKDDLKHHSRTAARTRVLQVTSNTMEHLAYLHGKILRVHHPCILSTSKSTGNTSLHCNAFEAPLIHREA